MLEAPSSVPKQNPDQNPEYSPQPNLPEGAQSIDAEVHEQGALPEDTTDRRLKPADPDIVDKGGRLMVYWNKNHGTLLGLSEFKQALGAATRVTVYKAEAWLIHYQGQHESIHYLISDDQKKTFESAIHAYELAGATQGAHPQTETPQAASLGEVTIPEESGGDTKAKPSWWKAFLGRQ